MDRAVLDGYEIVTAAGVVLVGRGLRLFFGMGPGCPSCFANPFSLSKILIDGMCLDDFATTSKCCCCWVQGSLMWTYIYTFLKLGIV